MNRVGPARLALAWPCVATAVVALVGLLCGCRRTRAPILTTATALQVMDNDRRLNDRANATLDQALQDRHESGGAAEIDDEDFRLLRQAGKATIAEPFQETQLRAFVPLQYDYPAEFLGEWTETTATGAHGTSLALFVRAAPADAWKATWFVFAPSDSPDPLPALAVDRHGYAARITGTELGPLNRGTDHVAAELATYWNRYRDATATPPEILGTGNWTSARNQRVRQDVATKASRHQAEQFVASPGRYESRSAFRTRSGDALVFLSIVERVTVSVAPPLTFVAPLTYRGQQVLPLTVTQGAEELSVDVLYLLAAVIPRRGGPARVIDGYSGPIGAVRNR